jgi:hypothetical protein
LGWDAAGTTGLCLSLLGPERAALLVTQGMGGRPNPRDNWLASDGGDGFRGIIRALVGARGLPAVRSGVRLGALAGEHSLPALLRLPVLASAL